MKATLEGVTDLRPTSEETFTYFMRVQCSSCRELHPNIVGISRTVRKQDFSVLSTS